MDVREAKEVVELEAEVASFLAAVAVAVSQRVMKVLKAEVDTPDQTAEFVVLVIEKLDAREAAQMDLKPAAVEVLESVTMLLLQYHSERFGGLEILCPKRCLEEGKWVVEQTEMGEFEMSV